MAASMVRTCTKFSLSRQLVDIWRQHNTNYVLQTLTGSYAQYQCYHLTPAFYKKKRQPVKMSNTLSSVEKILNNSTFHEQVKQNVSIVEVWNNMTVKELAMSAKRDINDVLDILHILNRNQICNKNTILTLGPLLTRAVRGLGAKPKIVAKQVKKKEAPQDTFERHPSPPPSPPKLVSRHPVVTIMGHVDHGKTTLLDALRNTSVADSEFGGITQHIGAFDVTLTTGERVTFLDTPGHAAFTSMRYRGAHVTDIVILVVAADDGVKDQTLQSIEMATKANVPIIVAINKIDKPNIDVNKTQQELAKYGIVVEELGGDIQCVKLSALKGINLRELTEAISLQAEIMNLKGDVTSLVEGIAIECSNHVGRGKLVSVLIKRGTLRKGCLLVSGLASAKVRAMFNDSGFPVLEAKPSEVVQIIGWKTLPDVGDEIVEVKNDKVLQEVLKLREKEHNEALAMQHKIGADQKHKKHLIEYKKILEIRKLQGVNKSIIRKAKEQLAEKKEIENSVSTINIILKGDVGGSVEALLDILNTYTFDNMCRLNVIHYGIGPIVETDIELAEIFDAIIYGFNISMDKTITATAKDKDVDVRLFNVVYKLIDNLKDEINNALPNVDFEEIKGEAEVLQNIEIKDKKKKVNVAGCRCTKGVLVKSDMYRVIRKNQTIYTGKVASMRHLKEEVSSVELGLECGLKFEDPTISFQPKDIIVCFNTVNKKPKLDWDLGF
ncbi:Translation initiation factor IF-2, mitochondrial [Anthophora quadrimaculata]